MVQGMGQQSAAGAPQRPAQLAKIPPSQTTPALPMGSPAQAEGDQQWKDFWFENENTTAK
jgi:hypothetical protein